MQAKFVGLAVVLCLFAAVAGADTITSVTPESVPIGSSESFISIVGTGLIGAESTFIEYDSGDVVEASATSTSSGIDTVVAYVPVGVTLSSGPHTFTVIATDAATNVRRIGPGVVTVGSIVVEEGPPQITVPESVVAEAENTRGANVTFEVTGTSFDGSPASVSCSPESGSLFPLGSTRVVCTATDAFGSASDSFVVLVTDTTSPVLFLPADIDSLVAEVNYTVSATDALDGDVPVVCTPGSGSAFPAGTTTVHCVAHDEHFNYAFGDFHVTVTNGPPALTVPEDYRAEATGPGGALVDYDVSATGSATVSCSPASGTLFPFGNTLVSCTATNIYGSVSDSFNVYVIDTFAPVLTLPTPVVDATSDAGAIVNYTATATDLVDGDVPVTCDPPSGSQFPIGVTIVECTASDSLGNATSGVFMLTVNDFDRTPPEVTVANVTAEATSAAGAIVTYSASAFDDVDGVVPVTCVPASGTQFPIGSTLVQCTATDAHGNVGTGSFYVTVRDSTGPTITSVTASPGKLWPPNHKMVLVTVTVVATDAVDDTPTNKILSVTSNQPVDGTGDGDTAPDWNIVGPLQVQLRAERSSGVTRTYTITVQSKDDSGNASTKTVKVLVAQ